MDLGIEGRAAIVTGGSKGIGRGAAEALAAEGCHVAICARNEDELEEAAREIEADTADGVRVLPVKADVTREDDRRRLVGQAADHFGTVDILVNNAGGVGEGGTFQDTPVSAWRDLFELNLFSAVEMTRKVLPGMREQGWGRIVNVSSENGTQPYPDMIHYNATKAALNSFTKALSKAHADEGVLVNAVSPAFIMTPLVEEMMEDAARERDTDVETVVQGFLEERRPHIEVGRPGRIDEVGPVIAFLCSERASFVNGADYRVDGGSVAAL